MYNSVFTLSVSHVIGGHKPYIFNKASILLGRNLEIRKKGLCLLNIKE